MTHLADALNIASTLTLIGALVFAALQVRVANRMRAEQAALAIIEAIQSEGWSHSLSVIIHLPDNVTPEQIDDRGPQCTQAIEDYGVRIETVGYMVFRGIIAIETIEELLGGAITSFWAHVRPWVERDRKRTGSRRQFEWVQWLAERLEDRKSGRTAEPAYLKYADWQPARARPTV
ncbi:MAG TPA: hypothetical protein VHW69_00390 [Rhizomicrobium sp.]|jgi:hypothetical protein|nr:hypothetical protein [Rhizomicrobium sp.]